MIPSYKLSHREALALIDYIRAELETGERGAAIAVADEHGELLAFLRTDNCPLSSLNNALNKSFTASRERKETWAIGQASREKGFPMTNFGDLRFTGWGGGVPIVYQGRVVGSVAISGLPEMQDRALAQRAADWIVQKAEQGGGE